MARWLDEHLIGASPESRGQLEEIVAEIGRSPWLWGHAVTFGLERRSHRVLYKADGLEVALFGWAAGQETTFHDHGGASGAAFVCSGLLIEDVVDVVDGIAARPRTLARPAESAFSFGPDYVHRVRHAPGHGVCLSIHAYTPSTRPTLDYDVRPDYTVRIHEPAQA